MRNPLTLQPQPQLAVAAVDLVPGKPTERDTRIRCPLQHQLRQLRLGPEYRILRHPGLPPPLPVLGPYLGQVQFPVQQRPAPGAGIGQENANLTVLDPSRRAAVLTLHPNGLAALLEKPGLVYHQNPTGVAQMLHNIVPEVIPDQVRIPPVVVQQALHSIGSGVARLLRQLPAVLSLHGTEQSPQSLPSWKRG